MTLDELEGKLEDLGLPKSYFSLNELTDGIHVAYYEYNNKWRVYRQERDEYSIDEYFDDVEKACDYVYEKALQEARYHKR